MDERMTVEERTARQSEIRARLGEIDTEFSGATLPERTQTEWDDLNTEYGQHDRAIVAASQRANLLRTLGENPGAAEGVDNSRAGYGQQAPNVIRRPDDIYDLNAVRNQARSIDELPGLMRDRAMRAMDEVPGRAAPRGRAARRASAERRGRRTRHPGPPHAHHGLAAV